jgi:taurine dioxygenase
MDTGLAASMEFKALDAPLGAEVTGLDIASPIDSDTVQQLKDAWQQYHVLLIRDQSLDDKRLIEFSKLFGELDPPGPNPYGLTFLPDHPELNVISNVIEDGKPIGNLGDGEAVWHADMTYIDKPPVAAVLYALEVPEQGGDTWFADMFTAYETLPQSMKDEIDGKIAVHDSAHNSAGMLRKGYSELTDVRETPGAHHPLARTEPETGRKALFLGRRPHAYIIGMEVADSDALLDKLWDHVAEPRFAMCHQWRAGDVLMWRNLCVLHRRDAFAADVRRVMHRTQIKGEERIS